MKINKIVNKFTNDNNGEIKDIILNNIKESCLIQFLLDYDNPDEVETIYDREFFEVTLIELNRLMQIKSKDNIIITPFFEAYASAQLNRIIRYKALHAEHPIPLVEPIKEMFLNNLTIFYSYGQVSLANFDQSKIFGTYFIIDKHRFQQIDYSNIFISEDYFTNLIEFQKQIILLGGVVIRPNFGFYDGSCIDCYMERSLFHFFSEKI